MNAPDTAHECGDFVMQTRSVLCRACRSLDGSDADDRIVQPENGDVSHRADHHDDHIIATDDSTTGAP
jgi:hypothetical protein